MSASHKLPDPREQPTLPLWPDAAEVLGLGRSAIYNAVARGEVPVLRYGRRIVVPTAALWRILGLDVSSLSGNPS